MKRMLLILITFFASSQLFGAAEPETRTFTLYACYNYSVASCGSLTVKKDDLINDLMERIRIGNYNYNLKLEHRPELKFKPGRFAVKHLCYNNFSALDPNSTVQSAGLWDGLGNSILIISPKKNLIVKPVFGLVDPIIIEIESTLSIANLAIKITQKIDRFAAKIDMSYKGKVIEQNDNTFIGNILGLWEEENPIIHFVIRPD